MKHVILALTASLGLMAAPATAAVYTDWVTFDPVADNAQGTLGPVSVNLSGGDVDLVFTDPVTPFFASPNFIPSIPASEAVSIVVGGFPSGNPATTVTFGSPVTDPVIYIANLESTLTFDTPVTVVSGSASFVASGNQVSGAVGDEGIIRLSGSISSFSFTGVPNFGLNIIFIQIGQLDSPCTIVCPADVIVPADPNKCSTTGVALGTPTLSGGCVPASLANNAPATFEKGTTIVTWTVTDTAGTPLSCQQRVTVVDNQAPVITCPPGQVVNTAPGACSATVTVGSPTTFDNCAVTITSGTRSDGQALNNPYPKGMTVITWTAQDAGGLQASCAQTITVEDHEAPQFTCPPNVTVATLPPPVSGGTDNCDIPTVTSLDVTTPTACGSIVTRTYTARDTSGNTTTCQQIITVGGGSLSADAIFWHQPLARNGMSEDTDPSAGGTLKYRFKAGSTIPIKVHAMGCAGDVTGNANVIGSVDVFGDSNCDGVADGNQLPIDYNGVGGAGGLMDKMGGLLRFNLDTTTFPTTTQCFVLRVTVTDTSSGLSRSETVLLQAK